MDAFHNILGGGSSSNSSSTTGATSRPSSTPAKKKTDFFKHKWGHHTPSMASSLAKMVRGFEEIVEKLPFVHSSLRAMRAALVAGDEEKALVEYTSPDKGGKILMEDMPPSTLFQVSQRHSETTAMHLAAEYAMKTILLLFLEKGGNPNIRSSKNETVVHCICQKRDQPEVRLNCLEILLDWRGPEIDGQSEKASVNAVDNAGCTAVHYAAAMGMTEIVKYLVKHGANLTIVNKEQETASVVAAAHGFEDLADWLEAQTVFHQSGDSTEEEYRFGYLNGNDVVKETTENGDDLGVSAEGDPDATYITYMSTSEVEARRDLILQSTLEELELSQEAQELVESLLHKWSWNKAALVRSWKDSPAETLEKAGLEVYSDWVQGTSMADTKVNATGVSVVCPICQEQMSVAELHPVGGPCGHRACAGCLKEYVSFEVKERNPELLKCPEYGCNAWITEPVIIDVMGNEADGIDILERHRRGRVMAFVERAEFLSYCTAPDCEAVVERRMRQEEGRPKESEKEPIESCCGNGHHWCWTCKQEPHGPCRCEAWKCWKDIVAKETVRAQEELKKKASLMGESTEGGPSEGELYANALWLSANTKECPKCGTPIEKNSGCNHMICGKRCNRFIEAEDEVVDSSTSTSGNGSAMGSARNGGGLGGSANNSGSSPAATAGAVLDGEEAALLQESQSPDNLVARLRLLERESERNKKGSALEEARRMAEQSRRMARFIHHYTRFRAHVDSAKIEERQCPLTIFRLERCLRKSSITEGDQSEEEKKEDGGMQERLDLQFVRDAFHELSLARALLQRSYAFAFFQMASHGMKDLKDFVDDESRLASIIGENRNLSQRAAHDMKHQFEMHQSELEMLVETLSGIIEPPKRRIHATKYEVIAQTKVVRRKRLEFREAIKKGPVPRDSIFSPQRDGHRGGMSSSSRNQLGRRRDHRAMGNRVRWNDVDAMMGLLMDDGNGGDDGRMDQQQQPRDVRVPLNVALIRDIYTTLDKEGLADMDLDVAMLDRAIMMSLQDPQPPTSSSATAPPTEPTDTEPLTWPCSACTYLNGPARRSCELCGTLRPVMLSS